MEILGRAAAEPQGSEAGVEFEAQGSLLFMGGTVGGVPHGSTGAAGLGADPEQKENIQMWGTVGFGWKLHNRRTRRTRNEE